jgi:hypothetical protein
LDQLRNEDLVAMQRGQSVADAACATAVINEINGYGGPDTMRELNVDVEDYPIVIESVESDIRHICEEGLHTMIDNGDELVLQQYDDNGQPTMEEHF